MMKLDQPTFLHYRNEFSLGHLTTESFHPLSKNLSHLSQNDLTKALLTLQKIDLEALTKLQNKIPEIYQLHLNCREVLNKGNKIFIAGCGATGRLALSLEKIFIEKNHSHQVVSFMAGGDFALIKSVESFEDNFEYGSRQLEELGFGANDLLIAVTEGGETSFVIGACEKACELSNLQPYFLYCNPDHELNKITRSKRVLDNKNIQKLNLTVGPMAISGSTRMQASTVQMLTLGWALFYDFKSEEEFDQYVKEFNRDLMDIDYLGLKPFIEKESEQYQNHGIVQYFSDANLAMGVLTDTTERSPTFNLKAFEMSDDHDYGLCYLSVNNCRDDLEAWKSMLGRQPRPLEWSEISPQVGIDKIKKFDISENSFLRRKNLNSNILKFNIEDQSHGLSFKLDNIEHYFKFSGDDLFFKYMAIKLLLNSHSTLIMGRLGRYEGNIMTYVRASNMKLIDRALRYIEEILKRDGFEVEQEKIISAIFSNIGLMDKPMVLRVVEKFSKNS